MYKFLVFPLRFRFKSMERYIDSFSCYFGGWTLAKKFILIFPLEFSFRKKVNEIVWYNFHFLWENSGDGMNFYLCMQKCFEDWWKEENPRKGLKFRIQSKTEIFSTKSKLFERIETFRKNTIIATELKDFERIETFRRNGTFSNESKY